MLVALTLVGAIVAVPSSSVPAAAGSATSSGTSSGSSTKADFNGDGFADLAVGVPRENVGGVIDAGALNVIYGSPPGLSATGERRNQFWHQSVAGVEDEPEEGDLFGSVMAAGDFNGDGFSDLAVGVPREDVLFSGDTFVEAGAVNVIYGSPSGLSATAVPDDFWDESDPNVGIDFPEDFDRMGSALAAGDFNGDGLPDLAIGVPREDFELNPPGSGYPRPQDAGEVILLNGSASGLSESTSVSQRVPPFGGAFQDAAEDHDLLGSALAAGDFNGDGFVDLAVGVPGEGLTIGRNPTIEAAGAVNVRYGNAFDPNANRFWHQSVAGVEDEAEEGDLFGSVMAAGDFNGDGFADLAVGVPSENLDPGGGSIFNVGAVNVLHGSASGLSAGGSGRVSDQFWHQDSPGVEDNIEMDGSVIHPQFELFGSALASGDYNGDGFDDLAVGVPGEDLTAGRSSTMAGAGAVNVVYGSASGLSVTGTGRALDQFWHQQSPQVEDTVEAGDSFGFALTSGDFNGDGLADLAVGVPHEDVGSAQDAGAANVISGSASGLSATSVPDQLWHQDTQNVVDLAESGDVYGEAVATTGLSAAP